MNSLDELAIDSLIDLLEKKQFKKKLIKKLNKSIDLPMLNEKTEQKAFDALYNLILSTLKKLNEQDDE
jgi:hypothetical protein